MRRHYRTPSILVCALLALLRCALCSASSRTVVEEFPSLDGYNWVAQSRAAPTRKIELTFAVKQQNLDLLERTLLERSNPKSALFGQHLTLKQVDALVSPSRDSVLAVLRFLEAFGLNESAVRRSSSSDFITIDVFVAEAERILGAKFYSFRHSSAPSFELLRLNSSYSLPSEVADAVDFVAPTLRFPRLHTSRLTVNGGRGRKAGSAAPYVTPAVLRELYGTQGVTAAASSPTQAVASFLGQFVSFDDLQQFFGAFDGEAKGREPTILGPNQPSNPGVEASLDIQYVMAMGNNVTTQIWSTAGQQPYNPGNEPFLTWLMTLGSTPDAGLPRTFTVSYADNERSVNRGYASRVNAEFQKAGLRGVTIVFGSGDGGVSGAQDGKCSTQFVPTFPAASPWVTTVGGTTGAAPEVAATFSSGGFSNYWARPGYQQDSVSEYMKRAAATLPPASFYNATGAAFPDVAAQSEGFHVVVGGTVLPGVDGTSCATPTFTGVVSLLNAARAAAGKDSLGYLNPLLYANPDMFTDITSGHNPGCGTQGFYAATGWDPITGLGTPNYAKLKEFVLLLP